jgi:hypothetical protein
MRAQEDLVGFPRSTSWKENGWRFSLPEALSQLVSAAPTSSVLTARANIVLAMNNIPHVTIAWSLGGLVRLILSCCGLETIEILLIGSGLMLGEGLAETIAPLVEHWSPLVNKHVLCSMKC